MAWKNIVRLGTVVQHTARRYLILELTECEVGVRHFYVFLFCGS